MSNYKKNRKKPGYWTKERCIEESKKYSTSYELRKADRGCHHAILDHGWQDECFAHMKYKKHRTSCFTKDDLRDIASKYNTFAELRKADNSAWDAMVRNNWVEQLCAHMPLEEDTTPLTFENCAEAAKRYTCKSDFRNSLADGRFYNYAYRHGFLNNICGHMQTRHSRKTRCIYAAEFYDHCVYVGLTFNHEYRWTDHLREHNSAVFQHIQETGLQPEFKIVHDYVKALEAQKLEGEYIDRYRSEGWTILNVAKAGSLGTSRSYPKNDVLEHARRYSSLDEFRLNDGGYYQSGYRSDYWNEVCAIFGKKAYHHYSEEEIMEAALQCSTRMEFQNKFKQYYQAAQRVHQVDKYCSHMKEQRHNWTDEELWEAALQCKTRYEFQQRFTKQYDSVRHSKRLDIFCAHMRTKNPKKHSFKTKGSK